MGQSNSAWRREPQEAFDLTAHSDLWQSVQPIAAALVTGSGMRAVEEGTFLVGEVPVTARAAELPGLMDGRAVVVVFIEASERKLPTVEQLGSEFGLTPREAQVALLLADRRSNKEIANVLEVTSHTASRHTEKILCKLGIGSRKYVRETLSRSRPVLTLI
jgi:DNA-binding CsgD family transcriptional regulator